MEKRPELAERHDLSPHPEGGWYRETWRSPVMFEPDGYDGPRHSATAILFLLQPGEKSEWHVVKSAELWFWHSGGELRLRLRGETPDEVVLGPGNPQALVPPDVWQAAEPTGDQPVLVSCVVSPGFEFADFRMEAGS